MATDLSGTGVTFAGANWMDHENPTQRLDSDDSRQLQAVNISRQQVFNPKVMGNTASTTAWKPLHAGLTLEAGVRLKNHGASGGSNNSVFIGVAGATSAGDAVAHGWELRPGEEMFLGVDNLNKVSRYGGNTLSYMAS